MIKDFFIPEELREDYVYCYLFDTRATNPRAIEMYLREATIDIFNAHEIKNIKPRSQYIEIDAEIIGGIRVSEG